MFHQIYAIIIKEFKILLHNRPAFLNLFILPIVFILAMTTALQNLFDTGGNDNPIILLAVNKDRGEIGAKIITSLKDSGNLQIIDQLAGQPSTLQAAEDLITARDYSIAFYIPADFSEQVLAAALPNTAGPKVTLIADPTVGSQILLPVRGIVEGIVAYHINLAQSPQRIKAGFDRLATNAPAAQLPAIRAVGDQFTTQYLAAQNSDTNTETAVEVVSPSSYQVQREPNSAEQNVPGYTIYGVFFIMQTIATSLFREKSEGTFRRLQTAPIPQSVLLIGKLIPYYIVNLVQIILMFAIGVVVFHMNLGNDFLALLAISLTAAAVSTGMGLLITTLGSTIDQVSSVSAILSVMLSVVGGMMVPIFIMPKFMQTIALFTPHAWALRGFQDVIVRGQDFVAILPVVGVLMLFAVIFWGLALWRFRFD